MLSAVSALASPPRTAPAVPFADRAVAALLHGGGELASARRSRPTGRLRYFAEPRPSGRVAVEVVESPYGAERSALEHAARLLRGRGFRVLELPKSGRLIVCAGRRVQ
jgi:hypothetical protein